jgi:hypothetical protein
MHSTQRARCTCAHHGRRRCQDHTQVRAVTHQCFIGLAPSGVHPSPYHPRPLFLGHAFRRRATNTLLRANGKQAQRARYFLAIRYLRSPSVHPSVRPEVSKGAPCTESQSNRKYTFRFLRQKTSSALPTSRATRPPAPARQGTAQRCGLRPLCMYSKRALEGLLDVARRGLERALECPTARHGAPTVEGVEAKEGRHMTSYGNRPEAAAAANHSTDAGVVNDGICSTGSRITRT